MNYKQLKHHIVWAILTLLDRLVIAYVRSRFLGEVRNGRHFVKYGHGCVNTDRLHMEQLVISAQAYDDWRIGCMVREKMTSLNSIPVERCTIKAVELQQLRNTKVRVPNFKKYGF